MEIILGITYIAAMAAIFWLLWWKLPRGLAAHSFAGSALTRLAYSLFILFIAGSIPGLIVYLYRVNNLRRTANVAFLPAT